MMRGGGVTQAVGLWVSLQLGPVDLYANNKNKTKPKIY